MSESIFKRTARASSDTANVNGSDIVVTHGGKGARSNRRRTRDFYRRKSTIDRWLGAALLVLTSPLMLLLFVLVKLTSRGPGFYRQRRVGLNGQIFEMVKLRSMVKDAEKPGRPQWCSKNDVRVTPLGRILRRLHLDELPQLWNVARGDMALVGPRPERPEICEKLAKEIKGYYDRVSVKPGVTGLAQVNLPPDETCDDVRRKQILDLRYIEEASFSLDVRLILATAMRLCGIRSKTILKTLRLDRRYLLPGADLSELERQHRQTAPQQPHQHQPTPEPRFIFSPDSDSGVVV